MVFSATCLGAPLSGAHLQRWRSNPSLRAEVGGQLRISSSRPTGWAAGPGRTGVSQPFPPALPAAAGLL